MTFINIYLKLGEIIFVRSFWAERPSFFFSVQKSPSESTILFTHISAIEPMNYITWQGGYWITKSEFSSDCVFPFCLFCWFLDRFSLLKLSTWRRPAKLVHDVLLTSFRKKSYTWSNLYIVTHNDPLFCKRSKYVYWGT